MVGAKAGQAMVATRLGGAHEHRTRPNIRIASCSSPLCSCFTCWSLCLGTRPPNPWSSWLLSSSRFRLERQLLGDASLNTGAKLQDSGWSSFSALLPTQHCHGSGSKIPLIYITICHWTHSTLPHARSGPQRCQHA